MKAGDTVYYVLPNGDTRKDIYGVIQCGPFVKIANSIKRGKKQWGRVPVPFYIVCWDNGNGEPLAYDETTIIRKGGING